MEISDAFLLEVAGIAASLLGFFVVGVFFFVQRGIFPEAAEEAPRYLQSATATIIVLYGTTLLVSLALVVIPLRWVSMLYLTCSFILLGSVARTSLAIGRLHRVLSIRLMSQPALWMAATAIVSSPWILGGLDPSRPHLTVAIGLTGIFAFASTASLVLSAFEISRMEANVRARIAGSDSPTAWDLAQPPDGPIQTEGNPLVPTHGGEDRK